MTHFLYFLTGFSLGGIVVMVVLGAVMLSNGRR